MPDDECVGVVEPTERRGEATIPSGKNDKDGIAPSFLMFTDTMQSTFEDEYAKHQRWPFTLFAEKVCAQV